MAITISSIVFCLTVFDVVVGDYCIKGNGFYDLETIDCPFGCCGTYPTQNCCAGLTNIGMIVGIVIGSLFGLAVIIGVTIYLCVKKQKKHKGRVIYPAVVGGNTVVGYSNQNSSSNAVYPPNPYGDAYGGLAPATNGNTYGNYPPSPAYGNAYGGVVDPYPPLTNQPPLGTQTDNGVADPFSIYNK